MTEGSDKFPEARTVGGSNILAALPEERKQSMSESLNQLRIVFPESVASTQKAEFVAPVEVEDCG